MKIPGVLVIAALLSLAPATAQPQGSIAGTPRDAGALPGGAQTGEPFPLPRPVPPLVILPEKPGGYGGPECVHGVNETDAERLRRQDAFNAMRLIYSVLQQVPADGRGFPDWPTLSRSSAVAALKKRPGTTGELANKIAWGSFEPLPGWRMTYVPGISVTYALRDTTDPCGYTLSSNDPHVIPPIGRTMPLS